MSKEQARNYIKESPKIIITIKDWGYSKYYLIMFPYFNVYFLLQNFEVLKFEPAPEEERNIPYWSRRKKAFRMHLFGARWSFECLYSFINWAFDGQLKSEEINEIINQKMIVL